MAAEHGTPERDASPKVWDDQALVRTLGSADTAAHDRVIQRDAGTVNTNV